MNASVSLVQVNHSKVCQFRATAPNDQNLAVRAMMRTEIMYCNYATEEVVITGRDGVSMGIPVQYRPNVCENVFKIVVRRYFDHAVKIDVDGILSADIETLSQERKELRLAFNTYRRDKRDNHQFPVSMRNAEDITVFIEYVVTMDELKRNGGVLYLTDLDIVVRLPSVCPTTVRHPESPESKAQRAVAGNDILRNNKGPIYLMELVSNTDEIGDRYVNMRGDIIRLKPIRDPERQSGVHTYRSYTVDELIDGVTIKHTHLPIDEITEDNGFYRTIEEARVLGDPKVQIERKWAQEKLDLQDRVNKSTLAIQEHKIESERLTMLNDIQQRAIRQKDVDHQEEMTALKRKYETDRLEWEIQFERRNRERKESSEILKWMPLFLTGVIAIIGAIFQAMKKDK